MSNTYLRDEEKAPAILAVDPEVLFFPNTRSFCIQGHPEYMHAEHTTVKWLRDRMMSSFFGEIL